MATMIMEVYEAFMDAGASEEKARAAARAIADDESRFAKIESDLIVFKWMVGLVMAGVASLITKTFF